MRKITPFIIGDILLNLKDQFVYEIVGISRYHYEIMCDDISKDESFNILFDDLHENFVLIEESTN